MGILAKAKSALGKRIRREPEFDEESLRRTEADGFVEEHAKRSAAKHVKTLERDQEKNRHKRTDERLECFTAAQLTLPDRGVAIDGAILEASAGGLTFRPAANYMEDRTGEAVQMVVEGLRRRGIIRSSRVNGYGVQLFEKLSKDDLELLRERSLDIPERRAN
ncbi:MAG: hypothetical protein AAGC56_05350 [Pseudomonadota bacterium]